METKQEIAHKKVHPEIKVDGSCDICERILRERDKKNGNKTNDSRIEENIWN